MQRIVVFLILAASTSLIAAGQTKSKTTGRVSKVEQQLVKLEHEWIDAFAKPDRAQLERLMTDDYVSNNADGSVTDKAQSIAASEAGFFSGTSSTSEDVKIRIYGDVAVITSLDTVKGKFNGQFRHTSIWVKRKGRWQVLGWQGTAVSQR
jgi:hypothetical protein